jgi:hypothetical protein
VDERASPGSHAHAPSRGGEERSYARRRPEASVLYGVVQQELETFLARARKRECPVPRFVERELRAFLHCGVVAHGFVRVHCDSCGLDATLTAGSGYDYFHPTPEPSAALATLGAVAALATRVRASRRPSRISRASSP